MMKAFLGLAAMALAGVALSASSSGVTFVQPGKTSTVKLELKLPTGLLINRAGPSELMLEHPFKKEPLIAKLLTGTPYTADPENYFEKVPPVEWKLDVPKDAKPGVKTLKFEAVLFLCSAKNKVCYREKHAGSTELRIGSSGKDEAVVLEVPQP
jgi:hypothetical protein